jgi:hypothetical protein
MKRRQRPRFAELMIVNPVRPGSGYMLLGQDGVLYHLRGFGPLVKRYRKGRFFMGAAGSVYRSPGSGGAGRVTLVRLFPTGVSGESGSGSGRYFLGENGTLYELTE